MSQTELAQRVGVSTATISRLERANNDDPPGTDEGTLYRIALQMGVEKGHEFLEEAGRDDLAEELAKELVDPSPIRRRAIAERHPTRLTRPLTDEERERLNDAIATINEILLNGEDE